VKRNRIKRILREAYRTHKEVFKGLKVILLARGLLGFQEAVNIIKEFDEEYKKSCDIIN
jgi:ribonuclease P protein component